MERKKPLLYWIFFILSFVLFPVSLTYGHVQSQDRGEEETILVGRISHIEGQLLRYVPEEEDWVATVKDTPFGIDDVLYSSFDGRAEIIMPNNTWVRIGGDTQIQLVILKGELTEIDLASGKSRLYNKSFDTDIKVTTPLGHVIAPAETTLDMYIGENAVEVIALKGTVYFVHKTDDTRHEVIAGSSSLFAGPQQISASEGHVRPDWDTWNKDRDFLWAQRMKKKGKSAQYLPPGVHDDAYILEKYGIWERVYYDGAYFYFWRPTSISVGWAPFTVGRWTVWYGDHTWIPYEPFGYVTHHYGNWIFIHGYWYWAPPVTPVMIHAGLPLLNIGFAWYPGRVAWIYSGIYVGWIPLAPYEPYYCHRRWGPRSITVVNIHITHYDFGISRYRHCRHAVVVNQNHLYHVNNYKKLRIRSIRHTNKYKLVPVINHEVINNFNTLKKKSHFSNPHGGRTALQSAKNRIKSNRFKASPREKVKSEIIHPKAINLVQAKPSKKIRSTPPNAKNRAFGKKQPKVPIAQVKGKSSMGKVKRRLEDQRKTIKRTRKAPPKRLSKPGKQLLVKWENPRPAKKEMHKRLKKKSVTLNRKVQQVYHRHLMQKRPETRIGRQSQARQHRKSQRQKIQAKRYRKFKNQGRHISSALRATNRPDYGLSAATNRGLKRQRKK